MNDAFLVSSSHTLGRLYCDIESISDFQWTLCNQIFYSRAFHKPHREENRSFDFINFKHGADVGMIQCGHRFRLTLELLSQGVDGKQVRGDDLQSHRSIQLRVLSFVHHSHTALTELLLNLIMRDGATYH